MAILVLAELKPGMRLARGVVSPQGALLANPGDELTEKQIRLFKMWGVVDAEVVEDLGPVDQEADFAVQAFEDPSEEIDFIFERQLDDPVMYRIAGFAKQLVTQKRR